MSASKIGSFSILEFIKTCPFSNEYPVAHLIGSILTFYIVESLYKAVKIPSSERAKVFIHFNFPNV